MLRAFISAFTAAEPPHKARRMLIPAASPVEPGRLAMLEEAKTMPIGAVWDHYCVKNGVPPDGAWLRGVRAYERDVLARRT